MAHRADSWTWTGRISAVISIASGAFAALFGTFGLAFSLHDALSGTKHAPLLLRWWLFLAAVGICGVGMLVWIVALHRRRLCGALQSLHSEKHDFTKKVFNNLTTHPELCSNENGCDVAVCLLGITVCDHVRAEWRALKKDFDDLVYELGMEGVPVPQAEGDRVRKRFSKSVNALLNHLPDVPLTRDVATCATVDGKLNELATGIRSTDLRASIRRQLYDPFSAGVVQIDKAVADVKDAAMALREEAQKHVTEADACYSALRDLIVRGLSSIHGIA